MTYIGQGRMVELSAPGKIAAPPTLRWESGGGGSVAIFPAYMRYTDSVTVYICVSSMLEPGWPCFLNYTGSYLLQESNGVVMVTTVRCIHLLHILLHVQEGGS